MQQISFEHTKKVLAIAAISCIAVFMSSGSNAGTSAAPATPAATYKSKCASCHGANGSGQTAAGKAMKLRDLRSAEVRAQSDEQLLAIIAKGKGKMPGYEKPLGADTCKALVAYMRTLK
jgi:cytochrome c6